MPNESLSPYFQHITADEVGDVFRSKLPIGKDTSVAKLASHNDDDALADELGCTADVAVAVRHYVTPRWPELF